MEARKLSVVRDDDNGAIDEEECLSVALWIFGLQIGPAQAKAYAYIYGQTLGKGRHSFDTHLGELIQVFGCDRRTIEGWMAALEAQPVSLIRLDVDPLDGTWRITCFRPRSFVPRRATKRGRDPQRNLPGIEDAPPGEPNADEQQTTACPVAPIVASKGHAWPTGDSDRAAAADRESAPPRLSPGEFVQTPPGECAQSPPGVFAQNPPSEVLELQRKLELKRSLAFVTRTSGAQKPPAPELLRSQILVSVSSKTRNRNLDLAGDFAQKPPPIPAIDSYGGDLPLPALTRQIQRDVGPALHRTVAHKVAAAIREGHIEGDVVAAVIRRAHDLVSGGHCPAAFVYFVSAMQAIFSERKIPWRADRNQRRPR